MPQYLNPLFATFPGRTNSLIPLSHQGKNVTQPSECCQTSPNKIRTFAETCQHQSLKFSSKLCLITREILLRFWRKISLNFQKNSYFWAGKFDTAKMLIGRVPSVQKYLLSGQSGIDAGQGLGRKRGHFRSRRVGSPAEFTPVAFSFPVASPTPPPHHRVRGLDSVHAGSGKNEGRRTEKEQKTRRWGWNGRTFK